MAKLRTNCCHWFTTSCANWPRTRWRTKPRVKPCNPPRSSMKPGCGWAAIRNRRGRIAAQPQPGFMDERGGLQGLTRGFVRHLVRGQFAQLVVNQWQQFVRSFAIALLGQSENLRDVAHAAVGN